MKDYQPKVSIVIPVYNGANYLREAIDSALTQTYANIEIIVVNDGSDDDGATDDIAKSYEDKIRYFKKVNGGVATALNMGINLMEGDYFSWLSHDDIYFPGKIETQIAALRGLNRDVILHSDYQFIDLKSKYMRTRKLPSVSPKKFQLELISSQPLHGCCLLIPKKVFQVVGTFDESLHTTQDYDLWVRMAAQFDFIHLPKVLISVRSHPGQGIWSQRPLWLKECNEFYTKHLNRILSTWDEKTAAEPLAVFALKVAIKMERFGLKGPLETAAEVIRKTWFRELIKFGADYYYWFGYYLLFRFKRFFMKLKA